MAAKTKKEKHRPVICTDPKFKGYLTENSWTLCLGAGISKGIVPDWQELANNVCNAAFKTILTPNQFGKLVGESGWTLDSWIQAAANKFSADGRKPEEFKELIESELYSVLRSKARGLGLEKYLTQVLSDPKSAPREKVIEVCDFLENSFPRSSLFQVGNALIRSTQSKVGLRSILTFNADTLLETYIDLKLRKKHYFGPPPYGHPEYLFVQTTRPSIRAGSKIPIVHCHGAIAPKDPALRYHRDSRDRLVFLEQEYLAMAASSAAWGETEFLHHAHSTKMVFLGLSMSDSNIRRWVNGINQEKTRDLEIFGCLDMPNPHHIWIKPKSTEVVLNDLYLYTLQHLGIRPAWIDSWSDVEAGIVNLCNAT